MFSVFDPLLAGNLCYWRVAGEDRDDLRAPPFFVEQDEPKPFNQLFAAAYDLILTKCERMGYLAPSPDRDIKSIMKEKVFGTDVFLVSAETVAYLKWLPRSRTMTRATSCPANLGTSSTP